MSGLLEQMCFNNRQTEGYIKIKGQMAVYSTGNEITGKNEPYVPA